MRSSTALCYALTISVAFTMLAGCSGGSSQMAPTLLGQIATAGTQSVQQQGLQTDRLGGRLPLPIFGMQTHNWQPGSPR
ncbi:MAG: hypothetical protein ABI282_11530 [Candidatus Baltobacteraceae bacterium]